jgi:AraC-like DNA-binding protein
MPDASEQIARTATESFDSPATEKVLAEADVGTMGYIAGPVQGAPIAVVGQPDTVKLIPSEPPRANPQAPKESDRKRRDKPKNAHCRSTASSMAGLEIARRHRITPRYIHKLFENEGLTFSSFVLGQRLSRAQRLLTDPHLAGCSISTVAFDVGFNDLSYFNRAFRRHYAATPTEIRQWAMKADPPSGE